MDLFVSLAALIIKMCLVCDFLNSKGKHFSVYFFSFPFLSAVVTRPNGSVYALEHEEKEYIAASPSPRHVCMWSIVRGAFIS